jgi:hypothetical protein
MKPRVGQRGVLRGYTTTPGSTPINGTPFEVIESHESTVGAFFRIRISPPTIYAGDYNVTLANVTLEPTGQLDLFE